MDEDDLYEKAEVQVFDQVWPMECSDGAAFTVTRNLLTGVKKADAVWPTEYTHTSSTSTGQLLENQPNLAIAEVKADKLLVFIDARVSAVEAALRAPTGTHIGVQVFQFANKDAALKQALVNICAAAANCPSPIAEFGAIVHLALPEADSPRFQAGDSEAFARHFSQTILTPNKLNTGHRYGGPTGLVGALGGPPEVRAAAYDLARFILKAAKDEVNGKIKFPGDYLACSDMWHPDTLRSKPAIDMIKSEFVTIARGKASKVKTLAEKIKSVMRSSGSKDAGADSEDSESRDPADNEPDSSTSDDDGGTPTKRKKGTAGGKNINKRKRAATPALIEKVHDVFGVRDRDETCAICHHVQRGSAFFVPMRLTETKLKIGCTCERGPKLHYTCMLGWVKNRSDAICPACGEPLHEDAIEAANAAKAAKAAKAAAAATASTAAATAK